MTPELWLVVVLLSLGAGIITGMLGGGGALVLVPLLLYGPPLLHLGSIPVKAAAAISLVYATFATTSGIVVHRRHHNVNPTISLMAGGVLAGGALLGGVLSKWTPDVWLLALFSLAATLGAALLLLPGGTTAAESGYRLRRPWVLAGFFPEGLVAGMVGVGGGFLTVPILHRLMDVPLRLAIGTSLAVSWLGVVAGLLGKLVTGQVPFWLSLAAVVGATVGSWLGAQLSQRLRGVYLRYLLFGLLALIAVRLWLETLARAGVL